MLAKIDRTSSMEKIKPEVKKMKTEDQTEDTPGITAEMQEENSAGHKTSTLTNHHSSTAQSVGFPEAATGSRSTLWDVHRSPTACSTVPKHTS